jgi:hypothetical protein
MRPRAEARKGLLEEVVKPPASPSPRSERNASGEKLAEGGL